MIRGRKTRFLMFSSSRKDRRNFIGLFHSIVVKICIFTFDHCYLNSFIRQHHRVSHPCGKDFPQKQLIFRDMHLAQLESSAEHEAHVMVNETYIYKTLPRLYRTHIVVKTRPALLSLSQHQYQLNASTERSIYDLTIVFSLIDHLEHLIGCCGETHVEFSTYFGTTTSLKNP